MRNLAIVLIAVSGAGFMISLALEDGRPNVVQASIKKPLPFVQTTVITAVQDSKPSQTTEVPQNSRYKPFLVSTSVPFSQDRIKNLGMLNLKEFQTTFITKMNEELNKLYVANPDCILHSKEILYMNIYLYAERGRGYAIQLPSGMYVILDCNK